MAPANEVATESATDENETPAPTPGTQEIAENLREAGYELTFEKGKAVTEAERNDKTAYIELEIPRGDLTVIEQIVKETTTTVEHQLIKPENTASLPDWNATSHSTSTTTETGTILIVPSPHPFPTSGEKAQQRALSL